MVLLSQTDTTWKEVLMKENMISDNNNRPNSIMSNNNNNNINNKLQYDFLNDDNNPDVSAIENIFRKYPGFDQYNEDSNDLQMDESKYYADPNLFDCIGPCGIHEECSIINRKSQHGICKCITGYVQNKRGECVKIMDNVMLNDIRPVSQIVQAPSENNKLTVSVFSKDVRLPEKEATLSAYTVPDEKSSGDSYQYLWTLISQPSGDINGTMSDKTKDHIKLTNLSEGLYKFKVAVTGTNLIGEAYANVTVLPEKRINKAPIVTITPAEQTVKLPTSKAILDGGASTVSVCHVCCFTTASVLV